MDTLKLTITILLTLPSIAQAFCFSQQEGIYGINSKLLQSIAETESNFNTKVIHKNHDGSFDIGLMQINSSWIRPLGLDRQRLISDPCYNVSAGARILNTCVKKHGYTWEAVGCYNAVSKGKRTKYSWKVYNQLKKYAKLQKTGYKKIAANPERTTSSLSFSVKDSND
ncbi:MAG: lytic transglycosylase domain-containing protein [Deltaproteobacteria bacterium]